MAFSNALYYPSIDIHNSKWLKTSLLFWDSISTIVPESVTDPYRCRDTQYLADVGYLKPLRVNMYDDSVRAIEEDFINLLSDGELSSIISEARHAGSWIWRDKLSYLLLHRLETLDRLQMRHHDIRDELVKGSMLREHDGKIYFPEGLDRLYMMTLANQLSIDYSLGIVTDDMPSFRIANKAKIGNQTSKTYTRLSRRDYSDFEQGILLDYIIEGLSISPAVSIEDIFLFKEKHKDELGRFRVQLANLTKSLDEPASFEAMHYEISDIYTNEFLPAYNDLKASLKGEGIKYFTDSLLKTSCFSISSSTVSTAILGFPMERALLGTLGLSVIVSAINYNIEKKHALRSNPYSYLLSVQEQF